MTGEAPPGIVALALARAAYGIGTVFAPDAWLRSLGFPSAELNPTARLWAGLFGVRELILPTVFDLVTARRGSECRADVALRIRAVDCAR
jgi:hypothetical protein